MDAVRISRGILVALAMAALTLSSGAASARPRREARPAPASTSSRPSVLSAVDGTSPTNAWAVGNTKVGAVTRTLIERWNGTSWQIQQSPNVRGGYNVLTGVVAISPTDAWAIGTSRVSGNAEGLIEHWDGSTWAIQPSAQVAGAQLNLSGVSATSATDVWAVGYFTPPGSTVEQTFIEHWDGTSWTQLSSPNATANTNFLSGVAAVSPSIALAVGAAFETNSNVEDPLAEQWDGTAWSVQSSQSPRPAPQDILAAVTISPEGVPWAVGSFLASNKKSRTLIEQLGPSGWTIYASPNRGGANNFLTAVTATSVTNVWAAGQSDSRGIKTLVEHWDGQSWVMQKTPNEGAEFSALQGADATATNNAWVVGYFGAGGDPQTLIEHWNGSAWRIQKSPKG